MVLKLLYSVKLATLYICDENTVHMDFSAPFCSVAVWRLL